jgi:hypothetical protein
MGDAFRGRSSGGFSGGRSGLLLWISLATMLGAALIAICPSAKANVTPEVVLRVHVQDTPDSSFCQTNPITACNQIRRATYASGEVEFDMYVHPILLQDHLPLHGVSAALVWPATWQVQEFEPCSGGVGSLQVGTAGGQLELLFPGDPPLPDSLFLIARFVVEVTGEGTFGPTYPSRVTVGPGPNYTSPYALGVDATAGLVCSVCGGACSQGDYCRARFLNTVVLYEGSDGTATGCFQVTLGEVSEPGSCHESWTTDQPWLEVTSASAWHPYPRDYQVWVKAHAVGLMVGVYEGHVTGLAPAFDCSGCGLVRFTVNGTSAVPDAAGPLVDPVTWGQVKRRFR